MVTIKDIARELGVSVATVSRSLHNNPDISESTRRAVQECAERLNYRPNMMAASLRKSHNTTIGVIVPSLAHHFYSSVLDGIEQASHHKGYTVLICQSGGDVEAEKQNIQSLMNSRVAGIIACVGKQAESSEIWQDVISNGMPLVLFDRDIEGMDCDYVLSDDYEGAFRAVEYLIQTGCRRIAFCGYPYQVSNLSRRYVGYRDALTKYGVAFDETLSVGCEDRNAVIGIMPRLLREKGIDAVFCINDQLASGVLAASKMLGVRVPNELSICGFGGNMIAKTTIPMLTSVDQHGHLIGKETVDMLLDRIEHDVVGTRKKVIKTDLIVRETTR